MRNKKRFGIPYWLISSFSSFGIEIIVGCYNRDCKMNLINDKIKGVISKHIYPIRKVMTNEEFIKKIYIVELKW